MRALISACLIALLPLVAAAQDNPIVARMGAFAQVYNAGDAAGIAAFYTTDAVLLPPGQRAVVGKDAIAAHYQAAFEAGAHALQFKVFDIRPLGDTAALEIGETVVMLGAQRIVGRYMHLWQVVDGQLLLTRDMYHVLTVK